MIKKSSNCDNYFWVIINIVKTSNKKKLPVNILQSSDYQ